MTAMLEFDAEAARQVEAVYLTADVVQQRREVLRAARVDPGEAVLDIGSGPGLLATDMAQARPGGSAGSTSATACSPLPGAMPCRAAAPRWSIATVAWTRCRTRTGPSMRWSPHRCWSTSRTYRRRWQRRWRCSGPAGGCWSLDTDWDSIVWHSTDPDRMRRILLTWEQHLADPFLPRTLGRQLRRAGFDVAPPQEQVYSRIMQVLPETVEIAADITVHLARRRCEQ